ncbi:MAG TPA: FAD-dependent oxidoreductase [Planctomycetota bacterium]|nr:FAD-dependent oxidoreductase [Planctomycetota bacterium]
MGMKLIVVGGVAGGASAAARARRLSEDAEILMFERGEFISFANCGLPYHVGGVIPERSDLMLMTPEGFRRRTNIEVRTRQEVTAIDRARKTVTVRNLETGGSYEERYDALILATGSSPVRPPLPGADDPDVMQLWTIPDMDRIVSRVKAGARRAVVIGAGFIGLEVAENLRERGLEVDLVEMLPQVLPTLDAEMAGPLAAELAARGIRLHLGARVTGINRPSAPDTAGREIRVCLDGGTELPADFVILSVGVRPNSELAAAAGLPLSERRGVVVDERMRTSDPAIYAVGDVVAVNNLVTGKPAQIPLAGPANRQGRIAAENVFGRRTAYKGSLGTAVVKVFGLTAASAGLTERQLRAEGLKHERIYLHPLSHAGYYPGAQAMHLKLLFSPEGKVLGVQAVGREGVDKRVDVIATAMRGGLTVYDLEELELAYAPPYGSAKDPVNFAGMVAANVLRGDSRVSHAGAIPQGAFLLDVREPAEHAAGHLPGSTLIPLGQLRGRLRELPRDRHIVVYCKVGLRGYLAERILRQQGFDCSNLSGGMTTWKLFNPEPPKAVPAAPDSPSGGCCPGGAASGGAAPAPGRSLQGAPGAVRQLDLSGLQCPGPIVRLSQEIERMAVGEEVGLKAQPAFGPDLAAWCRSAGHEVVAQDCACGLLTARVRKCARPEAGCCSAGPAAGAGSDSAAIVCFSNDLDKVMAAFIIATGLATLGTRVKMFFTFWGLNVLRKEAPPPVRKDLLSRMFGWMMPRGARKLALSKMHMAGMGTAMMKHVMAKKNVSALPELITKARELGVKFIACDMAMDVMGMKREELLDSVDEVAGVATFAALARESGTVLFI